MKEKRTICIETFQSYEGLGNGNVSREGLRNGTNAGKTLQKEERAQRGRLQSAEAVPRGVYLSESFPCSAPSLSPVVNSFRSSSSGNGGRNSPVVKSRPTDRGGEGRVHSVCSLASAAANNEVIDNSPAAFLLSLSLSPSRTLVVRRAVASQRREGRSKTDWSVRNAGCPVYSQPSFLPLSAPFTLQGAAWMKMVKRAPALKQVGFRIS